MELIIYKDIPCLIIQKKDHDSYLIQYKNELKWIYECSLGYGAIEHEECGIVRYRINEKFHRDKGPAFIHNMEYNKIHKEWWANGELHREGGPAVEYADGYKEWYSNGKYLYSLPK